MKHPVEFQRCHFEWLAEAVRTSPLYDVDKEREPLAEHFASALAATNPNFNREKFLAACGVES